MSGFEEQLKKETKRALLDSVTTAPHRGAPHRGESDQSFAIIVFFFCAGYFRQTSNDGVFLSGRARQLTDARVDFK